MRRIGVLGGTFDPVHRGHISLAQDAMEQANLDEVILCRPNCNLLKHTKK